MNLNENLSNQEQLLQEIQPVNLITYKVNLKNEVQHLEEKVSNYKFQNNKDTYSIDDIKILHGKKGLDKYLNDLPEEGKLKQIIENSNENEKKESIKQFQNLQNLKTINIAQLNLNDLKQESLNINYIISQINPPKFQDENINIKKKMEQLKSYIVSQQNEKPNTYEKNQLKNQIPSLIENEKSQTQKQNGRINNQQNQQNLNNQNMLIQISIYRSIDGVKEKEFIMHDYQTLYDLKQYITCIAEDTNQNLEQGQGSFFFIEDTFYNDNSHIDNIDLSEEFINKQQQHMQKNQNEMNIRMEIEDDQFEYEYTDKFKQVQNSFKNFVGTNEKEFQKKDMELTKLLDLEIVFGKAYIYRHIQKCDHMIIFSDIFQWNQSYPQFIQNYPVEIYLPKFKRHRCDACNQYFAQFMCFLDRVSDKCVTYFCEQCYVDIHQKSDENNKYDDFFLYPYIND